MNMKTAKSMDPIKQAIRLSFMLLLIGSLMQVADTRVSNAQDRLISDVNVLLPVTNCNDCRIAKHELQVFNGCY